MLAFPFSFSGSPWLVFLLLAGPSVPECNVKLSVWFFFFLLQMRGTAWVFFFSLIAPLAPAFERQPGEWSADFFSLSVL